MINSAVRFLLGACVLFTCVKGNAGKRCRTFRADVVFLLDASLDVDTDTIQSMKKFLANFVQLTEDRIDPTQVRLSVVTFSSKARVEFNLRDCPFSDDLVGANQPRLTERLEPRGCIGNISFEGTGRDAASAIQKVRTDVLSRTRPDAIKLLILLTTKLEDDRDQFASQADKLRSFGVHTLAIDINRRHQPASTDDADGVYDSGSPRFGTLQSVGKLHKKLMSLACQVPKKRRMKRAWVDHFDNCGEAIYRMNDPGKTCAVVTWEEPGPDDVDIHRGRNSGDCFPEGKSTVEYEYEGWMSWGWLNGDICQFNITVTVYRCPQLPTVVDFGRVSCSGAEGRVHGTVCTYSCNSGYLLRGSSTLTCETTRWSHPTPYCQEIPPPYLGTCRVAVINSQGEVTNSTTSGSLTHCPNQRNETINTVPVEVHYVVKTGLSTSFTVSDGKFGVVGITMALTKLSVQGVEATVTEMELKSQPICNYDVTLLSPLPRNSELDCEDTIAIPSFTLQDGENLCVDIRARSGGYYGNYKTFTSLPNLKRICFLLDTSKPVHCSAESAGCNKDPLKLSARLTESPMVSVSVEGWEDPIPAGGDNETVSKIREYVLEVHKVAVNGSTLSVEESPVQGHDLEWKATTENAYILDVSLPAEEPRLYAIILEVLDHAGNVGYARRLLLYDNSSDVLVNATASLNVIHANPRSENKWQTDISKRVCVEWTDVFYNSGMYHNNYLQPVKADRTREIQGAYDQQSGILPVSGTDNVNGIVKVELSWSLNGAPMSTLQEVQNFLAQSTCLNEALSDGQTYHILIRASDIMDRYKEDNVTISIDSSPPELAVLGLKGRLDRDVVYVHNDTDLSKMVLLVDTADPHSGLHSLRWTLGTLHTTDDIGVGAVAVQKLPSATACQGQTTSCYCPSVGECELDRYEITFGSLVDNKAQQGQHHRDYHLTVTAINHASLSTTKTLQILLDDSPPSTGVVWEGLGDDPDSQAEMDFTSSGVLHVRWHGFLDHESGVLLYRVLLAERCVTGEEMEAAAGNATVVEGGNAATLRFPEEGLYYTSVVAYNGAMEASRVACSDGIMYDTTPPRLLNVTITHARVQQSVACTQTPDRPWLINSNMTRVRLSNTSACHDACLQMPFQDISHLPVSSQHTVENDTSDDLCRRFPKMSEDSSIVLPSDYLRVSWDGEDLESDMEDYMVGLGTDRTAATAPDLLAFTSTQGHSEYHVRHSGLGHGDVFFVFLRAVSKAGLQADLTLGPVIIDVTPPDVTVPLAARVDGEYLLLAWDSHNVTDDDQPSSVDFDVFFRVGHEDDGFVTPFININSSSPYFCNTTTTGGCVRYPVSILHTFNTHSGRAFFFQLHVINAAGHAVTVNSSSVVLPALSAPSQAVVQDVIRTSKTLYPLEEATSLPDTTVSESTLPTASPTNDTTDQSSASSTSPGSTPELSGDVDVILQRQELCVAWSGLENDGMAVEVGFGTVPDLADVVPLVTVENTGFTCITATVLPAYQKLFSVVKASNSAGTATFASDGFITIPENEPDSVIQAFTGDGCTTVDVLGHQAVELSALGVDLASISAIPIHPGDVLFVELEPFVGNLIFSEALVLQTTLTGYQVVAETSHVTARLTAGVSSNTSITVFKCLKGEQLLLENGQKIVTVTWEVTGQWKNFIQHFKVEILDRNCLGSSSEHDLIKREQCLVAEDTVGSKQRRWVFTEPRLLNGRSYFSTVAACFDDNCTAAARSDIVVYTTTPGEIGLATTNIVVEGADYLEIEFEATTTVATETSVSSSTLGQRCVFLWTVARDHSGSTPITDWSIEESASCSFMTVHKQVLVNRTTAGTLYACIHPVVPRRTPSPSCKELHRTPDSNQNVKSLHVVELPLSTFRETDFEAYLHSQQLGSKLHDLYDLDVDFVRSGTVLSAVMTNGFGRNVTWYLTSNQHVPLDGDCQSDPSCVVSKTTDTGKATFPTAVTRLRENTVYFVCARAGPKSSHSQGDAASQDVCGDGVVIDVTPPVAGTVVIGNTVSGYLGDVHQVLVSWSSFSDVETQVPYLPDQVTFNYSVALGSYPGGEDIGGLVQVGQRRSHTFDDVHLLSGTSCIATVIAEDRVGLRTEVYSDLVIIDTTPPRIAFVAAGTTTQANFVSGLELPVRWEGVEDSESGITRLEVSVGGVGGESEFLPFLSVEGSSAILTDTMSLLDGHSYVVLLRATNGAGLTRLASSEPFIVDRSPPSEGVVRNSEFNSSTLSTYSTDPTSYSVHWTGFSDPHSGLAYYRVGLGSQPQSPNIVPLLYLGLRTSYTWHYKFDLGQTYFTLVEACNRANLCRVTSSSSITFDNSPPTGGSVTVGFDGHRARYLGHRSSLPVQWTGFSDPQTGVHEYWWCVGTAPESCDVSPSVHTMHPRATHRTGLSLLELYVTVRARNPAGLETVRVSDSFIVDTTEPEVTTLPRFLSLRDGSVTSNQWDRSVLHIAFEFRDPDSSVVRHTVYIRSRLTGRLLVEPVDVGADKELVLTLDEEHLAMDGDSYWATVVACNGASLCVTAQSHSLLIDSTPPVVGMFESPLTWTKYHEQSTGNSVTKINISWKSYSDPESGMAAYYLAAGRRFDGEDLSDGQVKVAHNNTTLIQSFSLVLREELHAGTKVYFTLVAENRVGLVSKVLRKSFDTFTDSVGGYSGNLVLERHSCEAFYCTKDCTCAPTDEVCDTTMPDCQELSPTEPKASGLKIFPYIFVGASGESLTTSAKCLEGRWNLSDLSLMTNISRFEWSYSLANTTPGEGVTDTNTEKIWHDVARNMSAVYCLPASRVLLSQESYVLHVRAWLSREESVTFVSSPVIVDHSPPQLRRGQTVIESDASCRDDVDFITVEPSVFACWRDVFWDGESGVSKYEVWAGTSPLADDLETLTDVGLNTSYSFSTSAMESGTVYYVSVRAWNSAGLQITAVSDGVTLDNSPPISGVVFTSGRYTHRHAQASSTSLSASWTGFEDRESGVMSYHVAVFDETEPNGTEPLIPFLDAGVKTSYTFDNVSLKHGHRYSVAVKALDSAGLESEAVQSPSVLVDTAPPEGLACRSFQLNDTQRMIYEQSSGFHFGTYSAELTPPVLQEDNLVKVVVEASGLHPLAEGYVQVEETKLPLSFKRSQNDIAVGKHEFLLSWDSNSSLSVNVRAEAETEITVKLFVCEELETADEGAVSIQHMSEFSVSICSRVRDGESGIRSLRVGVGTTPGGLQVQPLTAVGHSGHFELTTHVQHALPLYAVVIAENHAGQRSRFISPPIRSDHTPPVVSEVKVTIEYPDESSSSVHVAAEWTAEDAESGISSCNCHLEGHETYEQSLQSTNDTAPRRCLWKLQHPHHGEQLLVSVICENGVQIQKVMLSEPVTVLLRPPDITEVHISSLSNNAFASPYDDYDDLTRSSNSNLTFQWHGVDDPTLAQLQYRFLHESRPLNEWSPLHVYKSSAVLERRMQRGKGMITVQLRAVNQREMISDIVSSAVRLDDSKPVRTGRKVRATVTEASGEREIIIDWQGVFLTTSDVIYSVYAGTDSGNGDVINHVTTKQTKYEGWIPNSVSVIFVTIQAIFSNGMFEIYTDSLRL